MGHSSFFARVLQRVRAAIGNESPTHATSSTPPRRHPAPREPLVASNEQVEVQMPFGHSPTAAVLDALQSNELDTALALFRADPDKLAALLPPAAIFTIGTLLAKERQIPMAINALKKAAYANDPIAARALFLLARLYTDVRNDYDTAETHLRTLLKKFPQSPEAQGAEQMLKRLGYGGGPSKKGNSRSS